MLQNVHVVRISPINRGIGTVFCQESVYGGLILRLRRRIILIGHTEIVQDISVSGCRNQVATGQLALFIRVLGDDLKLFLSRVKVYLKITFLQITTFKYHMLHQPGQIIFIRIKIQTGILEIPHNVLSVLTRTLFAADLGQGPRPMRKDTLKSGFLHLRVNAVPVHIFIYILFPAGKLEALEAVQTLIYVFGAS